MPSASISSLDPWGLVPGAWPHNAQYKAWQGLSNRWKGKHNELQRTCRRIWNGVFKTLMKEIRQDFSILFQHISTIWSQEERGGKRTSRHCECLKLSFKWQTEVQPWVLVPVDPPGDWPFSTCLILPLYLPEFATSHNPPKGKFKLESARIGQQGYQILVVYSAWI